MINLNYKTPRKHLNDIPKSGKELCPITALFNEFKVPGA